MKACSSGHIEELGGFCPLDTATKNGFGSGLGRYIHELEGFRAISLDKTLEVSENVVASAYSEGHMA